MGSVGSCWRYFVRLALTPSAAKSPGNECAMSWRDCTIIAPVSVYHRISYAERYMSLSRLNHWLPRAQAHPEVMQGTAEFHHQITDPMLPQADPVLHDAAALDATVDMLNPQPTLVQNLVCQLLLQR